MSVRTLLAMSLAFSATLFACGDDGNDDEEGVSGDSIAECIAECAENAINGGDNEDCERQCEDVGE